MPNPSSKKPIVITKPDCAVCGRQVDHVVVSYGPCGKFTFTVFCHDQIEEFLSDECPLVVFEPVYYKVK